MTYPVKTSIDSFEKRAQNSCMLKTAQGKMKHPSTLHYKNKYQAFYKNLGAIFCPILQDDVHFKNIGWKHIRYDSHKHRRTPANIAMRFNLLPFVPEVVKNAKSFIKEEGKLKDGTKIYFYEITETVKANTKTACVTVIISEVLGGRKHYFSARYSRKQKKNP